MCDLYTNFQSMRTQKQENNEEVGKYDEYKITGGNSCPWLIPIVRSNKHEKNHHVMAEFLILRDTKLNVIEHNLNYKKKNHLPNPTDYNELSVMINRI